MNFNVPPEYQIQVTRKGTKTINGYDRNVALDSLQTELLQGAIPESNCWAVELCISGLYDQLWAKLISFFFKHVNYHHPGLLDYLYQQHESYLIIRKSYTGHLSDLCNNQELRNHIAELTVLLCLSTKKAVEIPSKPSDFDIIDDVLLKTHKLVTIFIKDVPKQSTLYQSFFQFVVNYHSSKIENCFYYLEWFARDIDYVVNVDLGFKTPSFLTNRSCLLIFKFLFLQIQTQIKVDANESYSVDDVNEVTDHLDTIFELYLLTYKRHDLVTCTNILIYLLVMSRCLEHFIPLTKVEVNNPTVIRQGLEINLLYKTIQNCPQQQTSSTTKTTKGKKKSTPQFYDDPRNQEYVNLIHNHDLLKVPDENQLVSSDLGNRDSCNGDGDGSIGSDESDGFISDDDSDNSDGGSDADHNPLQDITVVLCE